MITSNVYSDPQIMQVYARAPQWVQDDNKIIPFMFSLAAYFAKQTQYIFKQYDYGDFMIIEIYNKDCLFILEFDTITRECFIEFNADDSFNYAAFKKTIDSFLV